jgi:3',5'-nucleoside bisphosphate phosphatase
MPGYEPFLLCDFHVHTQWSDGKLTVREVVDLYGKTGKFDVIAITDHILMKKDLLARAGRLATLGRRSFGLREGDFAAYLADVRSEAKRAFERYGSKLVDVWEAANRDDLFSVTSLKHYPYVANSDFHKAKHLYPGRLWCAARRPGPRSGRRCAPIPISL